MPVIRTGVSTNRRKWLTTRASRAAHFAICGSSVNLFCFYTTRRKEREYNENKYFERRKI